jgi:hypothetical protein
MERMSDAPKTVPTAVDPHVFLAEVTPARRRRDAETVLDLMERVTGHPPVMWGPSIVGFGTTTLRYADGRTAAWPAAAFSPRRAATTIYLDAGFAVDLADDLAALGPHETGTGCLYLGDVAAVDLDVLERIVRRSWASATAREA